LQEQKIKHVIFRPINFLLSKCAVQILHYSKHLNRCLVPFNTSFSMRFLIAITQRASTAALLSLSDEFHVCVNDTNNDDVTGFPITNLGPHFHYTIDTLKYLTTGPEVGLSHGVQRYFCEAQKCDKKPEESYPPPSAPSHRLTIKFYTRRVVVCRANGYL